LVASCQLYMELCIKNEIEINTKSFSSKAEKTVGVNHLVGQVLWTRAFSEQQGHLVDKKSLYQ